MLFQPGFPIQYNLSIADEWSLHLWAQLRARLQSYKPSIWVHIFNLPTAFSFDEALLLCQLDEDFWLAWVPDYGEILLNADEFCHRPID